MDASKETPNLQERLPHLHEPLGASKRKLRVVVIGAGICGIQACWSFGRQEGIDLQCYEREDDIGGVWLLNKYIGVRGDIPSHRFQYSWALNPRWTQYYPSGGEFLRYLHQVAEEHNLRRFVKIRHACSEAIWDEKKSHWRLKIDQRGADGAMHTFDDVADVLLLATGMLEGFKWPTIPNLDAFKGKLLHSARWDNDYDFNGKRVASIGNSASAVQIVPAIYPKVKSLDIFIRSPTWITPSALPDGQMNIDYTPEQLDSFERAPQKLFDSRKQEEHAFASRHTALRKGSKMQQGLHAKTDELYERLFRDRPDLLHKLRPSFVPGCHGPLRATPFLETMLQPNVRVIRESIEDATPLGLRTADGETSYDAIICATGFETSSRPRFPVVGRNGIDLADLWLDIPELYLATVVHDYPNLAFMVGPGSTFGNHCAAAEMSARYIGLLIARLQERHLLSWDVCEAAQREYNEWYQERMKEMVFSDDCSSWYKTKDGRVFRPYPGTVLHFATATRRLEDGDFEWKRAAPNRFDWLGDGQLPQEAASDLSNVDLTPFLGDQAGVPIGSSPFYRH